MKTIVLYILLLLGALRFSAQQTIMYTQYVFNKAGMNPAASGTEITQKYSYIFGLNRQWLGFDNAPKSNFLNFSYTIRPPRSYRFWQNVGVYFDNEDSGLLGNASAYASYTIHYLIRKKYVCSMGVMAGVRLFSRSIGFFDHNDPALARSRSSVLAYPDIIPGIRISGPRSFMDLSLRQVSLIKQQNFKKQRIGSPSLLYPNIYFAFGRKKSITERFMMLPSVAVNLPVVGAPIADFSMMFYFANRVGAGASIRNTSFASAILQVRFLEGFTAGFAYSYPINRTRLAAPNSFEIMVGVVPFGMAEKTTGRNSVAKCPHLSY